MVKSTSFSRLSSTLLLSAMVLSAAGISQACGSRKNEDLDSQRPKPLDGDKNALVVAGNNTMADAVGVSGSCEVELKQSSEFDPSNIESPVTVIFKGRLEERCVTSGLVAQVFMFSEGKLTIPGSTCSPSAGEFNLKCKGDIIQSDTTGKVEVRFASKENTEQLSKLRIKIKYAEPG